MDEHDTIPPVTDIIGLRLNFSSDGTLNEEGWNLLSKAVQPYSDKRFETARYFFVRNDGTIIRQVSVSTRQPSATNIKPSEKFLLALRTYATDNDCRIVFMHNHPSGYVRPSEADIELTERLEGYFTDIEKNRRFLGHIISGYGAFGLYLPDGKKEWKSLINGKIGSISRIDDIYEYPESKFKFRLRNESDILHLSEKVDEENKSGVWAKERFIPCVFATQNGIIKHLDYIDVSSFSDSESLSEQLKELGRENNSDFSYFFPNDRKQFLMCEGFAQKTRMVRDVCYRHQDGTAEFSSYKNGRIFAVTKLDDIIVQDTDLILSREERDRIIGNKEIKGDSFMETNIKEQAGEKESNKLNFVLEKLEFAGIEVVQDKAEFDRIIEQEKLVQKMTVDLSEFEKTEKEIRQLKNSISNISEDNKNLVREQEFIDFQTSLIACKKYIEDLPEKELPVMPFITSNDRGEELTLNFLVKIKNNELVLTAGKPAESVLYNFETKVAESPWSLERFKDFTASTDCCEILVNTINKHLGEELGKQRSILKKLMQENAILSGKSLNELSEEETKELKEKLKEQEYENIEGIYVHKDKKIAVTPEVYVSEIQNAKLLVDHDYTVYLLPENFAFNRVNERGKNESFSTPDTITNDEFLELKTTDKRIGRRFGEALSQSNNMLIRIKDDISVYSARKKLQKKLNNFSKENNTNAKNGKVFLYFEKTALFISAEINNGKIRILPQSPSLSDLTGSRPVSSTISQTENKSTPQNFIQNNSVYGFAYEGKIYLNPDIMTSEVALHEYTHLWDSYTQRTNPELWQKGKDIFKNTHFWNDVKSDPNYADIADNDDLILSEVHSRICGKMAEKVLEKILERDGELTKNTVIDWDKETWDYICEEFLGKENITLNYPNGLSSKDLTEFLALPMKDFMEGREITRVQSVNSRSNPEEIEKKENKLMDENYVFQNGKQAHFFEQWQLYADAFVKNEEDEVNLFIYLYRTDEEKERLAQLLAGIKEARENPELLPTAVIAFDDYRRFADANHYDLESHSYDANRTNFPGGYEQWQKEKENNPIKLALDEEELAESQFRKERDARILQAERDRKNEELEEKIASENARIDERTFTPTMRISYPDGTSVWAFSNKTDDENKKINTLNFGFDRDGNYMSPKNLSDYMAAHLEEGDSVFKEFTSESITIPENIELSNLKDVYDFIINTKSKDIIAEKKLEQDILQRFEKQDEVQEKNLSEPEQEPVDEKKGKTLTVEERQALKDGALIRDFFENMREGYKTMQSEEGKDLWPDFASMFRDWTSAYTNEQKLAISQKIQELAETTSQEAAFKYLENRVRTDVAIEQGAPFEYNERNEKILKEYGGFTQEDKENARKFFDETSLSEKRDENVQAAPSAEEKEPQVSEPAPTDNETINLLKKLIEEQKMQLEEQKQINEALRKQNEMFVKKIDSLTEDIGRMREQIELYKGQAQKAQGGEAREQGRGDESYGQQEPPQNTEITRPGAFTNSVAWNTNQEIPRFGQKLPNGEIAIREGYVFGKFIENRENPAENTILIENPNLPENDPNRTVTLSEKAYRKIIEANETLEREKQNSQDMDSWEWYKAHEEYREKLNLDQHMIRSAIPENFMHNFRVICERAVNYDEAMDMAKILVDNFTSYGRKRFNAERKAYGAEAFDENLRKIYEEASKDKTYRDTSLFDKYTDPASKLFAEDAKQNPALYELPQGSVIPGTGLKVGDTIKMAMSFRGFNGKVRKTPATDWQIKKVSQKINPPTAVVYSDKAKCTYTVPLGPLVEHIKKVEKQMQKDKLKELKKDNKKYGTKDPLQDFGRE